MRYPSALPAALALLALGCNPAGDGEPNAPCDIGKCDDAKDVHEQLDGLDEGIAAWLRKSPMTDDGVLEADFLSAAKNVAKEMNCSPDELRTFVLSDDLILGSPFPRVIATVCSDSDAHAAEFFIAASFPDPDNDADVDVRNLEMFAWDKTQRRYVFYAMTPVPGSDTEVKVEVEPRRCRSCHLNSKSLDDEHMPMLPIMNELTLPWPHWNAEPGFESHSFVISDATSKAPNFRELTGGGRLASASVLEPIIRAGQGNRVIATRMRERRNKPADVAETMALLRPLFCDEQLNYVTEDHLSGVLPTDAVIAGGSREAFQSIGSMWPWDWANGGRMRFEDASDDPLAMIPVRGAADVGHEARLVSVRAIDATSIVRIRALDWTRPVLSEFRCGLWKDARARLRDNPPAVTADTRNLDLIPTLFAEIMQFDGESLLTGNSRIIAIADGETPNERKRLTVKQLGQAFQDRIDAIGASGGRDILRKQRDDRLCVVQKEFPNAPALPAFSCDGDPGSGLKDLAPPNSTLDSGSNVLVGTATGIDRNRTSIPDNDHRGASAAIELEAPGAARSVELRVAIDHGWRGDLALELAAPGGTRVPVAAFDPDDSADDVDAVFSLKLASSGAPVTGTWTLHVIDRTTGETGDLVGWSIGVNTSAPRLEADDARTAHSP